MKTLALTAILLLASFWLVAGPLLIAPPPNGHVSLTWQYDTNQLGTNLWFQVYEATNVTTPLTNWNLLTNMVGTNLSAQFDVVPEEHYFVISASNFWGETSITSPPGHTPPLAVPVDDSLKIEKSP